jgi:hypothetical protein
MAALMKAAREARGFDGRTSVSALKTIRTSHQIGKRLPLKNSSLPLSMFRRNSEHLNGSLGVGLNAAVIFRSILSWLLSPHLKAEKI